VKGAGDPCWFETEVALNAVKDESYAVVDGLTDEEASRLLAMARELRTADEQAAVLNALRAIPGVTVPDRWPPRFRDVEAVAVAGKQASQMLTEDRR